MKRKCRSIRQPDIIFVRDTAGSCVDIVVIDRHAVYIKTVLDQIMNSYRCRVRALINRIVLRRFKRRLGQSPLIRCRQNDLLSRVSHCFGILLRRPVFVYAHVKICTERHFGLAENSAVRQFAVSFDPRIDVKIYRITVCRIPVIFGQDDLPYIILRVDLREMICDALRFDLCKHDILRKLQIDPDVLPLAEHHL